MLVRITATICLFFISFTVKANIQVFTCEPEWKALVEVLGGEKVQAFSATTAMQDPHHIEARPSLIAKMRKADLLVCTGSGLEDAWLTLLIRQSANKNLSPGSINYFMASEHVSRLEIPERVDRSMGDIHGQGNPHIHLDPHRLSEVAKALSERLAELDSQHADYYQKNYESFSEQWRLAISEWETKTEVLKNKKVIVFHRSWSYLLDWLDMQEVADLEPKPGIPPTTAHLTNLLQVAEKQKIDFILIASYQNDKGARWLSERTSIPVLVLPYTVGGNTEANDLFNLFESTITILLSKAHG